MSDAQDLDQLERDAQMRAATAAVQLAVGNLDQTLAACASVSDEARAWVTGVALGYGQRLIRWAEENGRGNG